MKAQTLYAYVDGADLADVEQLIVARMSAFIKDRSWTCSAVHLVNQKHEPDPSERPGDLPLWDLGINLDLPDPGTVSTGWFDDIAVLVTFLAGLHVEVGRDFVIGAADNKTGSAKDFYSINSPEPDLEELKAWLGV